MVNVIHELFPNDKDRRIEFCKIIIELLKKKTAKKNIIFSDDAIFHLNGTVIDRTLDFVIYRWKVLIYNIFANDFKVFKLRLLTF